VARRSRGIKWRRSREDSAWIAGVGVLLGSAAAGIMTWLAPDNPSPGQSVIVAAFGVLAAGIGGWATSVLRQRAKLTDERERTLRQRTRGGLRKVKELSNQEFGVHAPVRDDRVFVERDAFDGICRDLAAGRSVLIVGSSMSGKTRLAVEALRKTALGLKVLLFNDGASLLSFMDQGIPRGGVVWLDDLERFGLKG
jgi:hypothetical protein